MTNANLFSPISSPLPSKQPAPFDQPVILQPSPVLSRSLIWGIAGVSIFSATWASVATIDEAIPATGKLAPQGAVKEVKVPINGVVKAVNIKDGQRVKKGDLLMTLDPTAAKSQLNSFRKIRTALEQETQLYRAATNGIAPPEAGRLETRRSQELITLTQNRSVLAQETQLYRAQLTNGSSAGFTAEQRLRLQSAQSEVASRIAATELDTSQLVRQLQESRAKQIGVEKVLTVNQRILNDIEPLVEIGAIARVQYLRQKQEVETGQSQIEQLQEEQARFRDAIAQAQQKLRNTIAVSTQELLTRIADNEKRIADIDDQLNKVIVENSKRIAETDSQISQAEQTLRYQEIRASANGTIFDLKVTGSGFVANAIEPVLKIVPDNALIAEAYITNKDIGFVKEGMEVDVRLDTFPFSEFGDIKGKIISIGSDALPPDQVHPYYRFPVKIQLDQQALQVRDRKIALQSGMSVSVNIKLRDRTVMSILTDAFTQQIDHLKSVR
ncbi:HlyD family efflux transporter periplasmic adaptor subunit [Leptolyngbya sp. NIES-2104]|uniref:HlyD family efflux transporter periplasmic adaptor subunit n=1 Tax=Leptolyngbya sp. NIES-2104 TaxID=1552121 RepID=UPI0006EC9113|nr:HlyD family efflux transporter periplasmic adaptor subunit [Leptolyngbya sp. NIES-2104]GAP95476.1 HlyD family secretion protein [Leptolyngbya sp. NIES-2104]